MERFCGSLGRHIKNRRNPYASLDRRVQNISQLQLIKLKYGLTHMLSSSRSSENGTDKGVIFEDSPCKRHIFPIVTLTHIGLSDSDYCLLPPERQFLVDQGTRKKLAAALVTRYSPDDPRHKISIATASKYVPDSIRQWGQVQICGGGDRFKCGALLKNQKHSRDCTYVKVCRFLFTKDPV